MANRLDEQHSLYKFDSSMVLENLRSAASLPEGSRTALTEEQVQTALALLKKIQDPVAKYVPSGILKLVFFAFSFFLFCALVIVPIFTLDVDWDTVCIYRHGEGEKGVASNFFELVFSDLSCFYVTLGTFFLVQIILMVTWLLTVRAALAAFPALTGSYQYFLLRSAGHYPQSTWSER